MQNNDNEKILNTPPAPKDDNVVFDEILSDLKNAAEDFTNTPDKEATLRAREREKSENTIRNTGYTPVNNYSQGNPPQGGNNPSAGRKDTSGNNKSRNNEYRDITPPASEERPRIKAEFSDIILLILTVAAVFSALNASFSVASGIFTSGLLTVFIAFVTAVTVKKTKKFPLPAAFPGVISLVMALSCSFSASLPFEKLIFSYYAFGLYCLALTCAKGYPIKTAVSFFHQLRAMLFIPIRKIFLPVAGIFRNRKIIPLGKIIGISSGVLLGIPVFVITALLLSSGDILFSNVLTDVLHAIVERLKEIFNLGNIAAIILTVFISPLLYSFLFSSKHGVITDTMKDNKTETVAGKLGFIPSSVLFGFYGIISVCYITYLFSQIGYLLSGFTGLLPEGGDYTLSLYARRGFFEMSGVAIINLVLIVLGSMFTKRNKKRSLPLIYKLFSSFFCIFTLILIITAIAKMALYITELGFTEKRIMVLIADIILLVVFSSILLRLAFRKFPYLRIITVFSFLILTVFFTVGTDSIITSYNTNMYISGKHEAIHIETIAHTKDDYFKLSSLNKLTENKDPVVAAKAKDQLYLIYKERTSDESLSAGAFTDILADSFIKRNKTRLEGYEGFFVSGEYEYTPYIPSEYISNYESMSIFLYIKEADFFTSFELTNDILNAKYTVAEEKGSFKTDDAVIFSSWYVLKDTPNIAKVTAKGIDGREYTFSIALDDIMSDITEDTTDAPEGTQVPDEPEALTDNTVYVSDYDNIYLYLGMSEGNITVKPKE